MAAAGRWNTTIDRGAVWRRVLRYTDAAGTPIEVSGPAFMDLRTKPQPDGVRVARLDSSGLSEGSVTFGPDINEVHLMLPDSVTPTLPVGEYYFDLFVTDVSGQLIKLVQGVATVRVEVSEID